ncbi:MAG: transcription antitermination factor NusB [Ruminococcaceae bacterium]|nr:transcription antitermination factor NusB [Oscillospiraceae bacterium]
MSSKTKLTRHQCRELIFKLLFAKAFDKEADPNEYYETYIEITEEPTAEYVKNVFLGVCEYATEIDSEIEECSIKWKMSRMSTATRTILRLAVYEMTKIDVPAKVVLNEALEIIKVYDDETAPAFVNGILNKIARNHGLIKDAE